MNSEKLTFVDPEIFSIIQKEEQRQQYEIDLIASENYASLAIREATGSVLTNKYAEGYPGKRYYGGCEFVDMAENLAIERCKKIFGADHVNVQPHAGSQANMIAYTALLQPGDTILGMSLASGGHLTHGHGVNFSGGLYKAIQYGVEAQTGLLNYGEIQKLAREHKPKLIIAGASAYSRTIDFEHFADIAESVGAYFMADIAHIAGLVAAGLHPSPIPYADIVTSTTHKTLRGPRGGLIMCKAEHAQAVDRAIMPGLQGGPFMNSIAAKAVAFHEALQPDFIHYQKQVIKNAQTMADAALDLGFDIVTGGTDNHMFIIDLRSKKVNGRVAETALAAAGISVSRSCIPNDPEKPWITSGIRIGTPAITTRGITELYAREIMGLAHEAIINALDQEKLLEIKKKVQKLCTQFPLL
ncbi:MAG: serine hydroxymethyltransferase [Candidatus Babeliaceae bacterium]|nr:serine hydroxymethyltransferase [Candidatus Babeliaceae bacterium]